MQLLPRCRKFGNLLSVRWRMGAHRLFQLVIAVSSQRFVKQLLLEVQLDADLVVAALALTAIFQLVGGDALLLRVGGDQRLCNRGVDLLDLLGAVLFLLLHLGLLQAQTLQLGEDTLGKVRRQVRKLIPELSIYSLIGTRYVGCRDVPTYLQQVIDEESEKMRPEIQARIRAAYERALDSDGPSIVADAVADMLVKALGGGE